MRLNIYCSFIVIDKNLDTLDGQKYIVTTTPIYDNREKFDFFVKIFTKI